MVDYILEYPVVFYYPIFLVILYIFLLLIHKDPADPNNKWFKSVCYLGLGIMSFISAARNPDDLFSMYVAAIGFIEAIDKYIDSKKPRDNNRSTANT